MGKQGTGTDSGGSAAAAPMIGKAKTDAEMGVVKDRVIDHRPPEVAEGKFDNDVYDLFEEAAAILITKHRDYGPTNISRSPGGPLNGLRVRMWDKVARINNLIDKSAEPQHESLRDSFIDLANYALIACLVLDGRWPSE